jgi:hypothetical protein
LVLPLVTLNAVALSQIGSEVLLPVAHQRQKPWMCVPTSAAMATAFYGAPQSADSIAEKVIKKHPHPGIFLGEVSTVLKEASYRWRLARFAETEAGYEAALVAIRASIDKRRPVLISTNIAAGHTMLAIGYGPNEIILLDPARRAPGIRRESLESFEKMFHEAKRVGVGRNLLFTAPPGVQA